MKFVLPNKMKQTKTNSTEIVQPFSFTTLYCTPYTVLAYVHCAMRMCHAESQRRSVKGSNFKENDRTLSL